MKNETLLKKLNAMKGAPDLLYRLATLIEETENKLFYIKTNDYPEGSEGSYIVTYYKHKFIMREYR